MLSKEQIAAVENKIIETVSKFNEIYGFGMKVPKYYFDISGGTTAGKAFYSKMTVHFNEKIALKLWDDFIEETIPHEVCHLAVKQWCDFFNKPLPKKHHGPTWKLMMREIGVKPRRCFDDDVSEFKKKMKEYEYKCGCMEPIVVSARIHNNIKQNKKRYSCKKCSQILKDGTRKINIGFSVDSPNGTTKTDG